MIAVIERKMTPGKIERRSMAISLAILFIIYSRHILIDAGNAIRRLARKPGGWLCAAGAHFVPQLPLKRLPDH
jgi:hypothetical protein